MKVWADVKLQKRGLKIGLMKTRKTMIVLTLFLEQLVFQKAIALLADTLERLDLTRKMKNFFCFNLKIYCIQVIFYE